MLEALIIAKTENREVIAAKLQVESSKDVYNASIGKYFPTVNLESKYTHLNNEINIDLNDTRRAIIQSSAIASKIAAKESGSPAPEHAALLTTNILETALPSFEARVQKQNYFNAAIVMTQPLYTGGKITANSNIKKELYESSLTEKQNIEGKAYQQIINSYYAVQLSQKILTVRKEALNGMYEHQKNANNLLKAGQLSKALKMKVDVSLI